MWFSHLPFRDSASCERTISRADSCFQEDFSLLLACARKNIPSAISQQDTKLLSTSNASNNHQPASVAPPLYWSTAPLLFCLRSFLAARHTHISTVTTEMGHSCYTATFCPLELLPHIFFKMCHIFITNYWNDRLRPSTYHKHRIMCIKNFYFTDLFSPCLKCKVTIRYKIIKYSKYSLIIL